MNQEKVIIVGAGIIGLCSAYYATKRGMDVLVLDRDSAQEDGCSFGNAGMIVPSHFIPLAAPGMISKGMRWMMNPESPFYVKPRLSLDLAKWGYKFWKHANQAHTDNVKQLLADLSIESRQLFSELAEDDDFGLNKKGLLMLCNTQKGLDGEADVAELAKTVGIKAEICDPKRLAELDPNITMDVVGGVWFEQDCHLEPSQLMQAMRKRITAAGGEIRYDSEVTDFDFNAGKVTAVKLATGEKIEAQKVVIAGGSWSPELSSKLGTSLCMQAGKGYSLTLENPVELPQLCSIFAEAKVAITPMDNTLRFAGTMEVGGNNLDINPRRVQGIVKSVKNYFPKFSDEDFQETKPWAGLRPCSPDGLPYIGKLPKLDNVVVATGHAMMGLSLGPVTGKMVTDLLDGSAQTNPKLAVAR